MAIDREAYRLNVNDCLGEVYRRLGGSQHWVSDEIGVPVSTVSRWLRLNHLSGTIPTASMRSPRAPAEIESGERIQYREVVREVDPTEYASMRMKVVKAEAVAAQARAEVKVLAKHANLVHEVREILLPAAEAIRLERIPVPKSPVRIAKRRPVTFLESWTDWHYGDNVDADEVNGENAFSPEIAVRRIEHVVDTTKVFADDSRNPIERLIVVPNGDWISNMHTLHPESATDGFRAAKQGVEVAMLGAQALVELAGIFPEIVVQVPLGGGNHDRTTKKSTTGKPSAQGSWAALIYELMAAMCSNQPNIIWKPTVSYRTMFDIYGSTICAMHGHAMKGGGGQLGIPVYSLARVHGSNVRRSAGKARRAANSVQDLNAAIAHLRSIVRHIMIGHFHTDVQWQIGDGYAMIDPSLKGPDTFSVDILERESPAAQKLRVFHPEHDLIDTKTIKCDHIMDGSGARYITGALEGQGMAFEILQDLL